TLLFQSLNMIGAARSALVSCLYSPFIIALSLAFLGERLGAMQLAGAGLIVLAVAETTRTRAGAVPVERKRLLIGIALGVMAELVMAIGVVMVKPVLATSPLLWAVEIRLAAGVLALLVYLGFHPRRGRIVGSLVAGGMRPVTLAGSVIGGYMAMMVWLGGFKLTQASIAAALNQTNAIFVLIFAAAFLSERITWLRALAIAAAVAGAIMVTLG
ncbi:MAG: DMT family transporter, partial [Candidatus Krumholzibacteria bacterium]|nr:DMT family transporter [Candidatus Krumholzibacteria bacterium]